MKQSSFVYTETQESIGSCSIEKFFLPNYFEIRREGLRWTEQGN